MDRYKTPTGGRSKSRGAFSKVVPIDAITESEETNEDRRASRHVNFNINRVIQEEETSRERSSKRPKSAVSQRKITPRTV